MGGHSTQRTTDLHSGLSEEPSRQRSNRYKRIQDPKLSEQLGVSKVRPSELWEKDEIHWSEDGPWMLGELHGRILGGDQHDDDSVLAEPVQQLNGEQSVSSKPGSSRPQEGRLVSANPTGFVKRLFEHMRVTSGLNSRGRYWGGMRGK